MQRGRKGSKLNVVSIASVGMRPQLIPSRPLSKPEQELFNSFVDGHQHLRKFDSALLTTLCISIAKSHITKDPAEFERYARISMSLAVKLRLTPSAVTDPKTLGRKYADAKDSSGLYRRPWDRSPADKDDDDASETA